MGVYEDRMKVNRAVTVITVLVIVALFASSIAMYSGTKLNDPYITYEQVDGNHYDLYLEYDRSMASGTVEVEVSEGPVVNKGKVTLEPMKDNNKTLYATMTTKDSFVDPKIVVYGATTDVQSNEQILCFFTIIAVFVPLAVLVSLATVRSLTTSVKRYSVNGKEITLYCGMVRHELVINGQVASKSNTVIPFQDANLTVNTGEEAITAEITMMNNPTVYVNGYLVEEYDPQKPPTENDISVQT